MSTFIPWRGLAFAAVLLPFLAMNNARAAGATFQEDVAFLSRHVPVIVLSDPSGQAQAALVANYQGRIMTSTAAGVNGLSFGWVNRELIASGKIQPHINVFGGEDRFWLGPEGGQFSLFFAKGVPFDLEHWFTPAAIDTQPFEVVRQNAHSALFRRQVSLTNYSGTTFGLEVSREVRLVAPAEALSGLGVKVAAGVKSVGIESVNTVKNTGQQPWRKETGLLSIWILGMLNASPATTIAVPYVAGPENQLGPVVNDNYFGKVPAERLVVKTNIMYFSADANCRSKIGVAPRRVRSILGSYDAVNRVLTLVQFTLPPGRTDYVNSLWKLQDEPYAGDVVNSYNDGPTQPGGSQMGRFYELETSSPALALDAGQAATHTHQTFHFQGPETQLDPIARAALGVSLAEIKRGLRQ